ncbi:hypothetical protein BKA70DRAFT_1167462 [Coprinopsis sp. MPI-PUGE-AT-0042]|nr:hypothetical protein BKA70DRAFT_1167462 [Coprinopsis sp. MPI-PUGE-AT-0042]
MDDLDFSSATEGLNTNAQESRIHLPEEDVEGVTSLTQSLSGVQVTGGNINVVGGNQYQHQHYHQHHYAPLQPTNNDMPTVLSGVPNYRDIHGANLGRATAGTGPRFSQWAVFCEWISLRGGLKTMWGSGMPGAGKTIFAAIVINEVEALVQALDSPICVGYIYFRYSDHTTATVRDFLEVLVKQTLERHSNCLPSFDQVYARHIRERTQPSENELLHLLNGFSELMEATFYFLDALDEAPPDVQLDLLEKLTSLNAKVFITSRPLTSLEAFFPGVHHFTILAQEHDLDLHIAKEISRSIVLRSILNQGGPALREAITSTVKQKCGGMFLHASLQLDALRDCASIYDVKKTLEDFPPRIEDVYQRTWNRILDQTPKMSVLARNVLVWVLCATRSLGIEELRRAVATCPDTHTFDRSRLVDEATLMGICRGLVNIEEKTDIVRFVHYTAKDVVKTLISESFPYPHSLPAAVCMALLTGSGFQASTPTDVDTLTLALEGDTLLAYAYEAWSIHAQETLNDTFASAQLARFVQGCSAFPVGLLGRTRRYYDILEPLHIAAYFDLPLSIASVTDLLNPNQPTSIRGRMPLNLAIFRNSSGAVRELLSLPRTIVNVVDEDWWTPLMWALLPPINQTIVALLLAHPKIDVNAANRFGYTALMKASIENAEEAATFVLAHPKIKPNQVDAEGRTALMHATSWGFTNIVRIILANPSTKVNIRCKEGKTALSIAQEKGRHDVVKLLGAHADRDDQSCFRFLGGFSPFDITRNLLLGLAIVVLVIEVTAARWLK